MRRARHYATVCDRTAAHICQVYGYKNLVWFSCWRRNGYSLRDSLVRVRERRRLQLMAETLTNTSQACNADLGKKRSR